jgi:CRISPR-associated protein Cas6
MYWQEETDEQTYIVPDDVVDLMFRIDCPSLPVDHAWTLSEAIQAVLPWFADETHAGLHIIHGADSGNGWERPEGGDELIYLSRRILLTIRLPKHRVADAEALSGEILEISGNRMEIKGSRPPRLLAKTNTLYARHVICDPVLEEEEFIAQSIAELRAMNISFKKVLCGKSHTISTPTGGLKTRSLMVADLPLEDSVQLQQLGLGPHRTLGCGLFIAHKPV